MAFDMYLGSRHENIGFSDEYIFSVTESASERFPELTAIWKNFYSSFSLSPEQANALIHELMLLEEETTPSNTSLRFLVFRLVSFFSAAVRSGQPIRCSGD